MQLEISVPATLSNLGPGFDVLGMAVDIENRFEIRALDAPRYEAMGAPINPAHHVTLATMLRAQERFGGRLPEGLAVDQVEDVPRSRGLGSSATARVAGLVAYSQLTGVTPELSQIMTFATELEGHPDNAVPALVGGLTLAATADDGVRHLRLDPPDLTVALCVPDRTVETAAARRAMPDSYPRTDVVFNASRLAFLLAGLLTGDRAAISLGCHDRVHQPYRAPLIGPAPRALDGARDAGATAAFISGSGSTLAAFVLGDADPHAVTAAMAAPFEAEGLTCRQRVTRPRAAGAWPR